MNNEARFEDMIRKALKDEAVKLEATEDSLKKVKERIRKDEYFARTGRKQLMNQKLSDFLHMFNSYKPAIVLFCSILFVSLIFVLSEPARVMAKKEVKKLITMVYVVVKDENGKYDTVQVPMDLTNDSNLTRKPTYLNEDEFYKETGFNAKTFESRVESGVVPPAPPRQTGLEVFLHTVTQVIYIAGKPICWRIPLKVKIGKEYQVVLSKKNQFDLEGTFNKIMSD